MKYMLLIYMDEKAMSDSEREACYVESARITRELHAKGQYVVNKVPVEFASIEQLAGVANSLLQNVLGKVTHAAVDLGLFLLIGIVLRGSAFTFRTYDRPSERMRRRWTRCATTWCR